MALNFGSLSTAPVVGDSGALSSYLGDAAGNLVSQAAITKYDPGTIAHTTTGSLFSTFDMDATTYYYMEQGAAALGTKLGLRFDFGSRRKITSLLASVGCDVNNTFFLESSNDNVTYTSREASGLVTAGDIYNFTTTGFTARYVILYAMGTAGIKIRPYFYECSIKSNLG